MKPKTWINWVGWIISVPSYVAALFICYKVPFHMGPKDDFNKLMIIAFVLLISVIGGFEMIWHRKKSKLVTEDDSSKPAR